MDRDRTSRSSLVVFAVVPKSVGAVVVLLVIWTVLRSSWLLRRYYSRDDSDNDAVPRLSLPLLVATTANPTTTSSSSSALNSTGKGEEGLLSSTTTKTTARETAKGEQVRSKGGSSSTATKTTTLCSPYNSMEWLESRRWGNAGNEGLYDDDNDATLGWLLPSAASDNGSGDDDYDYDSWTRMIQLEIDDRGRGATTRTGSGGASNGTSNGTPSPRLRRLLLSQTLCHQQSRFVHGTATTDDDDSDEKYDDDNDVRTWTTRLVYLAMMHHQHRSASPEARARYPATAHNDNGDSKNNRSSENDNDDDCNHPKFLQERFGVGPWDYECRGAKYLITSLANVGIGANVRGGMVEALVAGLVSNRIVLFVNHSPVGHRLLKLPWALASCPRRDYQCFFSPPSPCVLTYQDLHNAQRLSKQECADLRRGVALPAAVQKHKVLHMKLSYTPYQQMPYAAAQRLHMYAMRMLEPILSGEDEAKEREVLLGGGGGVTDEGDTEKRKMLLRRMRRKRRMRRVLANAASNILQTNETRRVGYNYGAANLRIHHALTLYATRPNPYWAQRLREMTTPATIDPSTVVVVPKQTVGLPIRASDKCARESECLSFEQHLRATSALLLDRHGDSFGRNRSSRDGAQAGAAVRPRDPTLIFTSESRDMVRQYQLFRANETAQSALPFRFRLITNEHDVTPDSGYAPTVFRGATGRNVGARSSDSNTTSFNADEAMLSAMASIQLQLMARVTVGNCCSNFHVLLADLLQAGCGASPQNTFHCLQEHPDTHFRVCCGWFRNCKEERRQEIERMEAAAVAANASAVL